MAAYRRIFSIAKEVMGPEFLITENPFTYGNGAEVATGVIDAKRSEDDKVTFTQSVVRRGVREWYRNRVTKQIDPDV
ncbi:hypothetical protein HS125_16555 [bacterium]|nr:hypothetical protein [bacterium]